MLAISIRLSDVIRVFNGLLGKGSGSAGGGNSGVLGREPSEWVSSVRINEGDIDRINRYFRSPDGTEKVKIEQIFSDPRVNVLRNYDLTDEEKEEAKKMRAELKEKKENLPDGLPNDLHVILKGDHDFSPDSIVLEGERIDYAGLLALSNIARRDGKPPPVVITSNVLVVCKDGVGVVLHRRAKDTRTEPGKIHLFGGGYMPGGVYEGQVPRESDGDPRVTAVRELKEAAYIYEGIKDVPIFLAWDKSDPYIHFVQINYLFCNIPYKTYQDVVENFNAKKKEEVGNNYSWEGEPVKRSYKKILDDIKKDSVKSSDFAASGKAHLLLWLALGCPGLNKESPRVEEARKVFEEVMAKKGIFSREAVCQ